jgi:Fuc2NAc and GlcNAc transferase
MNSQIIQFTISSLLSFFTLALLLPKLRKSVLDTPNQRSSHITATPRGGGLAFVIIGTFMNYIFSTGTIRLIPIMCLPLAIIGFADDYKNISAGWRYFIQVITAAGLMLISRIDPTIWQIPFYILIITSIINFTNFMDGLDGIVAGSAVLLFAATSSWSLSGAVFGFLLWNWSPAKIFMGDVGSTFIGAVFAGLAFQEQTTQNMLGVIFLGFPLFADSLICIVRRLFHHENILTAHKKHLYQRLHQAGWTHSQVAMLYIASVSLLIIAKILGGISFLMIIITLETLLAFFLDQTVARRFGGS